MNIRVTLSSEEFEPVLIALLSKILNRELSNEEVTSILFESRNGTSSEMIAVIEPHQPTSP